MPCAQCVVPCGDWGDALLRIALLVISFVVSLFAISFPVHASPDRFDVVVIDAGHGGHDEGALGRSGLREKDLVLDVADIELLVTLLCKYETNRTKIDGAAKTMIIYDDDCVTPLRTFSLRDATGTPSTTDICERVPTAAGTSDGKPTCA